MLPSVAILGAPGPGTGHTTRKETKEIVLGFSSRSKEMISLSQDRTCSIELLVFMNIFDI